MNALARVCEGAYNAQPQFMGQQTNKIQKRRRRKAYLVRKKVKLAEKKTLPRARPAGEKTARFPSSGVKSPVARLSAPAIPCNFRLAGTRILIVDGHSMIFAWPEMRKLHTRRNHSARETLVKQLTEYQDFTGVHVAVVFDGQGGKVTEETEPGGIQVFYSGAGQTADDVIERFVATYGKENEITVATDDMLEQQTAITFGALMHFGGRARGDCSRRRRGTGAGAEGEEEEDGEMTNDETAARMKMIKRIRMVTAILLVLALALSMPALRRLGTGWVRYHGINKVLNAHNMMARANLMPARRTFDTAARGAHAVDLGYAKFSVSAEEAPVSIRVKGDAGTSVVLECRDFSIAFINPSPATRMDEDTRRTMEGSRRDYPKAAAFMQELCTDEVAARIAAEETRPVSLAEACSMGKDDYLLYNQKLMLKITGATGMDEVFWFENAQTKGIAGIGNSTGNREKGNLLLSSPDGGKLVGCSVTTQDGKPGDAGKMLEQIAASFVFTIDNISDKDEIKQKLSTAGIGR